MNYIKFLTLRKLVFFKVEMSGGGGECLCVWLPGGCFGGGGVSAREVVLVVVVLAKARWLCLGEV